MLIYDRSPLLDHFYILDNTSVHIMPASLYYNGNKLGDHSLQLHNCQLPRGKPGMSHCSPSLYTASEFTKLPSNTRKYKCSSSYRHQLFVKYAQFIIYRKFIYKNRTESWLSVWWCNPSEYVISLCACAIIFQINNNIFVYKFKFILYNYSWKFIKTLRLSQYLVFNVTKK